MYADITMWVMSHILFIRTLMLLIMGHYVADFALQNDWTAKNKAPGSSPVWFHVMTSHCMIQALSVYIVTHSIYFTVLEFIGHFLIDVLKCKGKIGFNLDQALHIGMKILFAYFMSGVWI